MNASPGAASTNPGCEGRRCCALSGASGYVGSRLKAGLQADGWGVIELSRRGNDNDDLVAFQLGNPVSPERLQGCQALIHCAYDFSKISWRDIRTTNVRGSELLLRAAREAGIQRLVYISSISAFKGCESLYGKAKLEVETIALSMGAWVIRSGLVYGPKPGGAFGALVHSVRSFRVLPVPGKGNQRLYLVHEDDLADAVRRSLVEDRLPSRTPVTVANVQSWSLRSILSAIGESSSRRPVFVPTPWRLIWAGLRMAEPLGLPIRLRSDSLISLVRSNPEPLLNAYEVLGLKCRPFEATILL